MFTNGYSDIPLFKDKHEAFVQSEYAATPDKGATWLSRPTPRKWQNPPPQTRHPLDRTRHARKAPGFSLYLAQFGPLAWEADIEYYDPSPYFALIDFDADGSMAANWHNGWSAVSVIDGSIDLSGVQSTEGAFVLFEPMAQHRFKAGPQGASIIVFYDSGQCAYPVWEGLSGDGERDLNRALRIPT
jgi:hypothetical protein